MPGPGRFSRGARSRWVPMPWLGANGLLPGRGEPPPGRGDPPGRGEPCRGAPGLGAPGRPSPGRPSGRAGRPSPARSRGAAGRAPGSPPVEPGRLCGRGLGRSSPGRGAAGRAGVPTSVGFGAPAAGAVSSALGAAGLGAPGLGAPDLAAPGLGAPGLGAPGLGAPGFGAAGFPAADLAAGLPPSPDMRSRRRRTTGASMVDDALRTNSPMSFNVLRTTLLSTPSSFASS